MPKQLQKEIFFFVHKNIYKIKKKRNFQKKQFENLCNDDRFGIIA